MNANRMLGITTNAQSKATEKLSSGYKINRAADDAAGLSISEKMRKQIRGLDKASSNAEDGVSAVQTAEGALTEVHSMLQRMNELAERYQTEGLFPDGSILQISDQSEIVPDQICFLAQASTFYLPEKALSDEQMLELIDFYAKRDYSVTCLLYTSDAADEL